MGAQACGAFVSTRFAFRTSRGIDSCKVAHRLPNPMKHSFRHVSRFEPHGVLIPERCPIGCPIL